MQWPSACWNFLSMQLWWTALIHLPSRGPVWMGQLTSWLFGLNLAGCGWMQATPVASLSSGPQAQSLAQFSSLLNYKQLTEDVFAKIREAFGEEECPDCGRLFHSRLDLEPHRMTHTEDKPFKCSQCSYNSGSKVKWQSWSSRVLLLWEFLLLKCKIVH